jgi:hypothetical protein
MVRHRHQRRLAKAPLGYDPDAHLTDEERRRRYITGEYADLIQH